ncbi:DNA repair exonuclease, partial [Bacillus cereus]|nr:DNA repair exonuclease [Bacillus cereus]
AGRTALYRELQRQSLEQQWAAAANDQELERMERSGSTDGVWIAEVRVRCRPDLDPAVWLESDSFLGDLVRLADRSRQDSELRGELLAEALRAFQAQPRLRQWLAEQPEEAQADWLQEAMLLALEALHEGGNAS